MKAVPLDHIKTALSRVDLIPLIEEGFVAYSQGRAVVPPVGELILERGEVHIKYGYIDGGEFYVIKIASGFFDNPSLGLPSGNGLMLVFRQRTGELERVLYDEGHLTDVRTAVAGAVAAKHAGPEEVGRVGIVGTGVQARLQLFHLAAVTPCRDVVVWGRNPESVERYVSDVRARGYEVSIASSPDELLETCDLIVTTTPSKEPLLHATALRPGVHITAVGSDTEDKQELDARILSRADAVVADSVAQCRVRGEIHHALAAGAIDETNVVELGAVIADRAAARASRDDITVADLTGVAVQDIQIATAVIEAIDSAV